jgi:hypothetical protein
MYEWGNITLHHLHHSQHVTFHTLGWIVTIQHIMDACWGSRTQMIVLSTENVYVHVYVTWWFCVRGRMMTDWDVTSWISNTTTTWYDHLFYAETAKDVLAIYWLLHKQITRVLRGLILKKNVVTMSLVVSPLQGGPTIDSFGYTMMSDARYFPMCTCWIFFCITDIRSSCSLVAYMSVTQFTAVSLIYGSMSINTYQYTSTVVFMCIRECKENGIYAV